MPYCTPLHLYPAGSSLLYTTAPSLSIAADGCRGGIFTGGAGSVLPMCGRRTCFELSTRANGDELRPLRHAFG